VLQHAHGLLCAGPVTSAVSLWRRLVAAALGTSPSTVSGPAATTSGSSSSGFSPPGSQPAVLITKQLPAAAAGAGGQAGRAVYAVQSSEDEDRPEDEETPAERLFKRFWRVMQVLLRTQLVQKLRKAINPPVTAVFAGGCHMMVCHMHPSVHAGGLNRF